MKRTFGFVLIADIFKQVCYAALLDFIGYTLTSKVLTVLGFGHAQRERISCLSSTGARFRKS